jgi:NAD(P)-dependent dehydrogenase (short-subunit alcohol dehydrogenase family)
MASGISGKTALVTGGASGIGRTAAIAFAREGAKVAVATGSNISGGEETARFIREAGGEAIFIKCDVSVEHEVEAFISEIVKGFGRLDFAFNNAGVGPDGRRIPVLPVADLTEEIWDRTIDVNLKGAFFCMKHEIRQMISQGQGGSIVNTASIGGLKFIPNFGAYAASKSGLIGLAKTAALECAGKGIRINTVCPGPTGRTLLMENISAANPEQGLEKGIPMGRIATTEEIANTVLWLCSDNASFITGQAISVDGGITAG